MTWCGKAWRCTAWWAWGDMGLPRVVWHVHSVAQCGMGWQGMAWCGVVWRGTAWAQCDVPLQVVAKIKLKLRKELIQYQFYLLIPGYLVNKDLSTWQVTILPTFPYNNLITFNSSLSICNSWINQEQFPQRP